MIWAAAAEFKVLYMRLKYCSYAVKYSMCVFLIPTTNDRSIFHSSTINIQLLYGHKIICNIDNNCIYSIHLCNSVKLGNEQL